MNKQQHYVSPNAACYRVIIEDFIAVSYTRSFSDAPEYYEYDEEPELSAPYLIIK